MTVLTEDNIIVTHLYSRLLTVLTEDIIVTHLYSRLLTVLTEDNIIVMHLYYLQSLLRTT